MLVNSSLTMIGLASDELELVIENSERFSVDFDDAYRCAVAGTYDLTIVSFDKDFDRTERGRKPPEMVPKASE